MILRILHWASRCFLAGVFLFSGYVKLQSPLQFAAAISGYQLLPENLVFPLATYLPWAELGLGVLLLTGWKIRYVASASACLLTVFIIVLAITYSRGIDADCGCFSFGQKISPLTITRDVLILLPAIFLVFEARFVGRRNSLEMS